MNLIQTLRRINISLSTLNESMNLHQIRNVISDWSEQLNEVTNLILPDKKMSDADETYFIEFLDRFAIKVVGIRGALLNKIDSDEIENTITSIKSNITKAKHVLNSDNEILKDCINDIVSDMDYLAMSIDDFSPVSKSEYESDNMVECVILNNTIMR